MGRLHLKTNRIKMSVVYGPKDFKGEVVNIIIDYVGKEFRRSRKFRKVFLDLPTSGVEKENIGNFLLHQLLHRLDALCAF